MGVVEARVAYLFKNISPGVETLSLVTGGVLLEMSYSTAVQNKKTNRSCRLVCKRHTGVPFRFWGGTPGVGSG